MCEMTSKERMLVAMTGGQPDMVPVAPDMSNTIPCKLTGKPFWDIYLYQALPHGMHPRPRPESRVDVRILRQPEESDLSSINPLEIPPLHTTEVMLKGTPGTVAEASKRAIDDTAEGGGFILSTGDQCGRDTPFANIEAMIEVARTYGRY